LAYELHYGQLLPGVCVLHHCDNPSCVNPEHLWVGTKTDNAKDRIAKGRSAKGEKNGAWRHPPWVPYERIARGQRHPFAKLTEAKVVDIRRRAEAGEACRELAKAFGVSKPTISNIVHGRGWHHVMAMPHGLCPSLDTPAGGTAEPAPCTESRLDYSQGDP
jgi:hypothetical protein